MDLQTFLARFRQLVSHPAVKLFIMPLTLLFYGIQYGAKIAGGVNILGSFVLYIFVFVMLLVEQYLFVNDVKRGYIKWEPLYVFDAIVLLLLLLLLPLTNLFFVILALVYVVSIHLMYALFQLKGTIYFLVLQVCLKAIVLTILASFMQVNVITLDLLIASLPLCAAILFYYAELERLDRVKYGSAQLSATALKMLSYVAWLASFVMPVVIGKLALTNIFFLIIWAILAIVMFRFTILKTRYIKTGNSKNYLSMLYTLFVLLVSLL